MKWLKNLFKCEHDWERKGQKNWFQSKVHNDEPSFGQIKYVCVKCGKEKYTHGGM